MKLSSALVLAIIVSICGVPAHAAESCSCAATGLLAAYNNTDVTEAVYGYNGIANGIGVWGNANTTTGIGVSGSGGSTGVYGASSTGYGVYGITTATTGLAAVYGYAGTAYSNGLQGMANNNASAIYAAQSGTGYAGYFSGKVNVTGALTCGSGCSSDQRLKKNIAPLAGALDRLLQIQGVTFEWKDPEEHSKHTGTPSAGVQTGVIAQDVQKVFPQWVHENETGYLSVDPDARAVLGVTVEALRQLKMENDALRNRVTSLERAERRPYGLFAMLGLVGLAGFGWKRRR